MIKSFASKLRSILLALSFYLTLGAVLIFFGIEAASANAVLVGGTQKAINRASCASPTTLTTTLPATPTAGNLIIAVVGTNGNVTITGPAGFTLAINEAGTATRPAQGIWYKLAGASEPSAVAITCPSASAQTALQLYEYSGVTGIDGAAASNNGASNTPSSGSITTTQNNDLIFAAFVNSGNKNYSGTAWSGGFTYQLNNNSGTGSFGGGNNLSNTAGANSTSVAFGGGSVNWRGQIIAFKDATAPTVSSVTTAHANGSFTTGEVIDFDLNYSENVTVAGGTPTLAFNSGGSAAYLSGSGTSTLKFRYTVGAGNSSADLDYSATSSLSLPGSSTIKDSVGNNANNTLPALGTFSGAYAIVIDTTAPTVTDVNSSAANGSYKVGDVINVNVTFSENVTVTGTPRILLETGATDQYADYLSGSGTNNLNFTYTVLSGDNSSDLDYTATTSLELNGGTIEDGATNTADLTLFSPGAAGSLRANKAVVIDGIIPTITSVDTTHLEGSFTTTEVIDWEITYSETVNVDTSGGTPTLSLNSGGSAVYASGSGTNILTFNYTVGAGDTSADLDYSATSDLSLSGGTIKDTAGNDADNTLPAVGTFAGAHAIIIDTTAPIVTYISASTADGAYKDGNIINVEISFTENLTVTGSPQLLLETGSTDRYATYSSGSGGNTLVFSYTVISGDSSADLDYTATNSLEFNGGTIEDAAGNPADLTLFSPGNVGSLAANKAIVIDTTAPILVEVTAVATPGTNTTPSYSFSSTETGAISYSGDCSSSTTSASSGTNTITFNALAVGTHSNCKIQVTDAAGNASSLLAVTSFEITSGGGGGAPVEKFSSGAGGNFPQHSDCNNIYCIFTDGLVSAATLSDLTSYFTDIAGHWAEQDIDQLHAYCDINGFSDQNGNPLHLFYPDLKITRAELVVMLIKCRYGILSPVNSAPFPDVAANHWAAPYVTKAKELGIVKGYEDRLFRPAQFTQRSEAVKMIELTWVSLSEIENAPENSSCQDIDQAQWYAKYFNYALNNGIVSGYKDGSGNLSNLCGPQNSVLRAEAAKIINGMRTSL